MSFDTWENELYHHGIRGQKWGVRRYQNSDGSLTAAGRVHYGYGEKQLSKANIYERKAAKYRQGAKNAASWRAEKRANKKAAKYERKAADERSGKALAKRKKANKIIAAAGAVSLAAVGAYLANKRIRQKAEDKVWDVYRDVAGNILREHSWSDVGARTVSKSMAESASKAAADTSSSLIKSIRALSEKKIEGLSQESLNGYIRRKRTML